MIEHHLLHIKLKQAICDNMYEIMKRFPKILLSGNLHFNAKCKKIYWNVNINLGSPRCYEMGLTNLEMIWQVIRYGR